MALAKQPCICADEVKALDFWSTGLLYNRTDESEVRVWFRIQVFEQIYFLSTWLWCMNDAEYCDLFQA